MEITIYAKKRMSNDGKVFYNYLATLPRKDGTEQTVSVKFRQDVVRPKPELCPMNIVFMKEDASVSKRTYDAGDGETGVAYTLWIGEWSQGKPYVDTSLDEFDI